MMQCMACDNCKEFVMEGDTLRVNCRKRSEALRINRSYFDYFQCEEYEESVPDEPEKPLPRIRFMFKTGTAVEVEVPHGTVLPEQFSINDFMAIGGFLIRMSEVVAIDRREICTACADD